MAADADEGPRLGWAGRWRVAVRVVAVGMVVWGACALVTARWRRGASAQVTRVSHAELPLSSINGVAVDGAGNVYVGSEFYERIQEYTPDGRFVRAFDLSGKASAAGGVFYFQVSADGPLQVYLVRTRLLCTFDDSGMRATEQAVMRPPFGGASDTYVAANGDTYEVAPWSWCVPRVWRTRGGVTTTLVTQSAWLWCWKVPVPGWVAVALGLLALMVTQRPRSRRTVPSSEMED